MPENDLEQHYQKVHKFLGPLRKKTDLRSTTCHKSILASRSPVFKAMLESSMKEKDTFKFRNDKKIPSSTLSANLTKKLPLVSLIPELEAS